MLVGADVRDRLLNVKETAAYLGVCRTTVQRWCRAGRLPAVRIGHEWRIDGERLRGMVGWTPPRRSADQVRLPPDGKPEAA